MINEEFIYIHIPKTAGRTIKSILHKRREFWNVSIDTGHINLEDAKDRLRGRGVIEDVPSFCFVRNPWEWYVSLFFYRTGRKGKISKKLAPFLKETESFERFMLTLSEPITLSKWHDSLVGPGVDHIGRMENFGEDLIRILKILSPKVFELYMPITEEELGIRINQSKHNDYRSYYDDKLIQIVYDCDRDYIEEFGYCFDKDKE